MQYILSREKFVGFGLKKLYEVYVEEKNSIPNIIRQDDFMVEKVKTRWLLPDKIVREYSPSIITVKNEQLNFHFYTFEDWYMGCGFDSRVFLQKYSSTNLLVELYDLFRNNISPLTLKDKDVRRLNVLIDHCRDMGF